MAKVSFEQDHVTVLAGQVPAHDSPEFAATRPYQPQPDSEIAHARDRFPSTEAESYDSSLVTLPALGERVGHYRIDALVGRGGMGVVYSATDLELSERVALKLLTNFSAARVYAFKQEFRRVVDVFHPNLAQMRELLRERERWFLAMEFVEGTDFVRYVRAELEAGAPLDDAATQRLRNAASQLAAAVNALHLHDIVHCDLKPSNVLVTPNGRVIALDFGITYLARSGSALAEFGEAPWGIFGTPTHIAPEHVRGGEPSAANDWYAFGVMLFEALTGTLPFDGKPHQVLLNKQIRAARRAFGPDDLSDLTAALLEREPGDRPEFREIVRCLGGSEVPQSSNRPSGIVRREQLLLARAPQLAALQSAYQASERETQCLFVRGAAGVGKSTLVEHFLAELGGDALVLRGRCHEREALPFRAVDSLIDEIVRHLHALPPDERAGFLAVIGGALGDLQRMFPLFAGVFPNSEATDASADPTLARLNAFAAVERVVRRLAEMRHVVVFLEDVHWGDADSVALLSRWFKVEPKAKLLFLASHRDAEAEPAFLAAWRTAALAEASMRARELELPAFTKEDAVALVRALWPAASSAGAERIALESRGIPLFAEELARFAAEGQLPAGSEQVPSFAELVRARVEALPESARKALALIALGTRPLSYQALARAGQLASPVVEATRLRAAHLVRTSGVRADDDIEPYHARVGECVRDSLAPELRREYHARLARALGEGPAEVVAFHWHAAGELERASVCAGRAGDDAFDALAFERAAEFYLNALSWASSADPERARWLERRALSLFNAGRSSEAAPAFEAAARECVERSLDLYRAAVEAYLLAGHVESGLALARPLLARFGMEIPKQERSLIAAISFRLLRLRWRGVRLGSAPPSERQRLLTRADWAFSLGKGLTGVLPFHGLYFCLGSLFDALELGDRERVARVLGNVGASLSITSRRAHGYLDQAQWMAEQTGSHYAMGLNQTWRALHALFVGRWSQVLDLSRRAAEHFERSREGSCAWEHNIIAGLSVIAMVWQGSLPEARTRSQEEFRRAEGRGDLYGKALFTQNEALCWLALGRVQEARSAARSVLLGWAPGRYTMQHAYSMRLEVLCDLYDGRAREAEQRYLAELREQRQHGLSARSRDFIDFIVLEAAIRLNLSDHEQRRCALRPLRNLARRLRRHVRLDGGAHADSIEAALSFRRGDSARARGLLRRASVCFESLGMQQHAAAARLRSAQLEGNLLDARRAEKELVALGVSSVAAWLRVLAPGFD